MSYKTSTLQIKKSPKGGVGVFATKSIPKGEIIETCYFIKLDKKWDELGNLKDYIFRYPLTGETKFFIAPLGCGMIYNHDDYNNATWVDSKQSMHLDFIAIRDIQKGEEIYTNYGRAYWSNKKYKKKYKTNNIWEHLS